MLSLIRRVRRPTAPFRALLLPLATLALACDEPHPLPTGPRIGGPVSPKATIVGATVTILPNLGGPFTTARDINDAGQVVGWSIDATATRRAFLWTAAAGIQDLGTLGGTTSEANAINESGQVVGFSETASGANHAFLWTLGRGMQDLGTLGAGLSVATGINDRGEVVGFVTTQIGTTSEFLTQAFRWTPGQGLQDLGTLGGSVAAATAINNAGQVVGSSTTADGNEHAFLWTPGQRMQDLGTLGTGRSVATSINDIGQVVGLNVLGSESRPVIWLPGQPPRELGTADDPLEGQATDVNDAGQVVGSVSAMPGGRHAFVWTLAGGTEDLYAATGMTDARAINNRGQIVGGDRVATLRFHAPNRAPVANAGGPYAGAEGSPVSLAFSATDPDGDALTYTWDLGDGTTGSGLTPPGSHVYADNGVYSVRLTVADGNGGADTTTTTAAIANVAPAIPDGGLAGPAAPVQLVAGSASVPIALAFTDPAAANDAYAAEIQCGNGVTLAPRNITSPYAATCAYVRAGVYTVRATVSDDDGGVSAPASYRYVVVYDPEGPSATGGGFYTVPGRRNEKAHFTFNARFLAGRTTVPNGTVRFWIPGGQLDFESTDVEMLVVAGNRAQFWGAGTLDRAAARFRITAVDGKLGGGRSADAIRIELWDASGALVYDSQPSAAQDAAVTTPIDGGNIQIHRE